MGNVKSRSAESKDAIRSALREVWVPDSHRDTCYHCRSVFKVNLRRHHCRACGELFCKACWGAPADLPAELYTDLPVALRRQQPVCSACSSVLRLPQPIGAALWSTGIVVRVVSAQVKRASVLKRSGTASGAMKPGTAGASAPPPSRNASPLLAAGEVSSAAVILDSGGSSHGHTHTESEPNELFVIRLERWRPFNRLTCLAVDRVVGNVGARQRAATLPPDSPRTAARTSRLLPTGHSTSANMSREAGAGSNFPESISRRGSGLQSGRAARGLAKALSSESMARAAQHQQQEHQQQQQQQQQLQQSGEKVGAHDDGASSTRRTSSTATTATGGNNTNGSPTPAPTHSAVRFALERDDGPSGLSTSAPTRARGPGTLAHGLRGSSRGEIDTGAATDTYCDIPRVASPMSGSVSGARSSELSTADPAGPFSPTVVMQPPTAGAGAHPPAASSAFRAASSPPRPTLPERWETPLGELISVAPEFSALTAASVSAVRCETKTDVAVYAPVNEAEAEGLYEALAAVVTVARVRSTVRVSESHTGGGGNSGSSGRISK